MLRPSPLLLGGGGAEASPSGTRSSRPWPLSFGHPWPKIVPEGLASPPLRTVGEGLSKDLEGFLFEFEEARNTTSGVLFDGMRPKIGQGSGALLSRNFEGQGWPERSAHGCARSGSAKAKPRSRPAPKLAVSEI